MEKVHRKLAVKTSSIPFFNFVNSPKQPMHVWDFEKQKCLELVTSLFEFARHAYKNSFLVWPFESGNCGNKSEKMAKDWIEEKNVLNF